MRTTRHVYQQCLIGYTHETLRMPSNFWCAARLRELALRRAPGLGVGLGACGSMHAPRACAAPRAWTWTWAWGLRFHPCARVTVKLIKSWSVREFLPVCVCLYIYIHIYIYIYIYIYMYTYVYMYIVWAHVCTYTYILYAHTRAVFRVRDL